MDEDSSQPRTVQVTELLDGIQITFNYSHRIRSRLSIAAAVIAMVTVLIGYILISDAHSVLSSPLLGLGRLQWSSTLMDLLIVSPMIATGVWACSAHLLKVTQRACLKLRAHELLLPSERMPLSEILFITTDSSPAVVLRGGRRIRLLQRSDARTRAWVSQYLQRQLQERRSDGSPSDIPAALAQLTQTTSRP